MTFTNSIAFLSKVKDWKNIIKRRFYEYMRGLYSLGKQMKKVIFQSIQKKP
nr:MAG TPA: hypothetical protein [Siphoviridae sp. ctWyD10]